MNLSPLHRTTPSATTTPTSQDDASSGDLLRDFYIAWLSRELSNTVRRDVLTGRAKFGVSDDGKELYQLAMARAIRPGDWRADYYRGHTLLLALELASVEDILAQLYSDAAGDPFSRGRQMIGHYATRTVDEEGQWTRHTETFNVSSATSPTAGQMARGLGLAFASKRYRQLPELDGDEQFSRNGSEISWTEIGDASTSEGVFWETMNAAGVLEVPLITTIVDDGYGISVPVEKQTVKGSVSSALAGMQAAGDTNGIDIFAVRGWDYPALLELYPRVADRVRQTHRAALIHVTELTQPNGHSTSGSHERYKGKERLEWEKEWDCLRQFRHWLVATEAATPGQLDEIQKQAKKDVAAARRRAWAALNDPLAKERDRLVDLLPTNGHSSSPVEQCRHTLRSLELPLPSLLIDAVRRLRFELECDGAEFPPALANWLRDHHTQLHQRAGAQLTSDTPLSPVRTGTIAPVYAEEGSSPPAYELFQRYFHAKFAERPELFAFGEDVGKIGDVNQGFAGLQEAFGELRVFDTGIREWTIMGQAMGMAMRGMRPIAEIQYLDYVYYALPMLTDDVATLRWRTAGLQSAPLIIRTRGHRLEGVWHSGSPMMTLLGSLRGMHLCVPRNATQAIGMYNTLLNGDDPALVVEVLNGYRLREQLPANLTEYTVPLGVPEVVRPGHNLTLVTYGACVHIAREAADRVAEQTGIETEVIDVQTLLPFDLEQRIAQHVKRTNRLLVLDEDVPGGASAYLRQQICEVQGAYAYLDAPARTLTAAAHRPAYADDGNYASKPQVMDVIEAILELARY